MKNWLKVLIAVIILGVIAVFLVLKFYINKPHEDIEKATPAFSMSTDDFWKFRDDMKLKNSKYLTVVELTGNVSKVEDEDTIVNVVFVMGADSMFGDKSIRCLMLPKYNKEAAALQSGTTIKIKGKCDGYDDTDVKLSKCSLVK